MRTPYLIACIALAACNTLWAGNPNRTNDIGVGIKSAGPPPDIQETVSAVYRCEDGSTLNVVFDNRAETASIDDNGKAVTLPIADSGSGFRYADKDHELRGKGDDATWTAAGKSRTCKATG